MFGYGRGRYRGRFWPAAAGIPRGYTYIGHCRCGTGPHAYYQTPEGRIVHAWPPIQGGGSITYKPTEEELKAEAEWLRKEKMELEQRLKEVEEELNKETK
jgi:hypothetical protein